jgi:hypothetical protein
MRFLTDPRWQSIWLELSIMVFMMYVSATCADAWHNMFAREF